MLYICFMEEHKLKRVEPADEILSIYSEHDDSTEIFCPHCGIEQYEHPINLLMDTDGATDVNCEECNKIFQLSSTQFIQYETRR